MSKIRTQGQYQKCPTCPGMFRPRELARHKSKCKGFKLSKREKSKQSK